MSAAPMDSKKLLAWIEKNPEKVIQAQREMSGSTCAMLAARLRNTRLALGIRTPQEDKELMAFLNAELNYISEHNYIFFLQLIGRMDLIKTLFFDREDFSREVALLQELERETERASYIRQQNNYTDKILALSKQQNPSSYWSQYPNGVSPMDLLHYYQQELLNIHLRFHKKQIDVFNRAFDDRFNRWGQMVDLIHADPSISDAEKKHLKERIDFYKAKREEIMSRRVTGPDGTPDHKAQEQQYHDMARLDEQMAQEVESFYKKYEGTNPQIAALHQEQIKADAQFKDELKENEVAHDEEVAQITPHLQKTLAVAKDEAHQKLSEAIDKLKEVPLHKLSTAEQQKIISHIEQLEQIQNEIQATKDPEQFHVLIKSASEVITSSVNTLPSTEISSTERATLNDAALNLKQMSTVQVQGKKPDEIRSILHQNHVQKITQQSPLPQSTPRSEPEQTRDNVVRLAVPEEPGAELVSDAVREPEPQASKNEVNPIHEKQAHFKRFMQEARSETNKETQQFKIDRDALLRDFSELCSMGELDMCSVESVAAFSSLMTELSQCMSPEDLAVDTLNGLMEHYNDLIEENPAIKSSLSGSMRFINQLMEERHEATHSEAMRP